MALCLPRWSALWHRPEWGDSLAETAAHDRAQLFLEPDDRWQQNEAASRAMRIVDAMAHYREQYLEWLTPTPRSPPPPLH